MKLWKRNAIVVVIVLFVGMAVYLNWSYGQSANVDVNAEASGKLLGEAALVNSSSKGGGESKAQQESKTPEAGKTQDGDQEQAQGTTTDSGTGYFASARLNRQQARDSALEILQQAAADAMADQAVIDQANASIQTLADNTLAEAQVENLVTAKGYADCVCYINENSASVVVATTETGLTDADTARIAEIVMDETGLAVSQIKIIETEP